MLKKFFTCLVAEGTANKNESQPINRLSTQPLYHCTNNILKTEAMILTVNSNYLFLNSLFNETEDVIKFHI